MAATFPPLCRGINQTGTGTPHENAFALLVLFLMIALPALSELTTQDMEKIRQIVKESETALKSDMEKIRQIVKESETALKSDIEKITSKIDAIDTRLRTVEVETSVAELRGRNIGFSFLKDSLVVICAVVAVIISIIALRKKQPTVSPTTHDPQKAVSQ